MSNTAADTKKKINELIYDSTRPANKTKIYRCMRIYLEKKEAKKDSDTGRNLEDATDYIIMNGNVTYLYDE